MNIVTPTAARSPFVDAWERAEQIGGWLSRREAQALFTAASNVPADGLIVEIGSFKGRSTTLLASTGKSVVSIDPVVSGIRLGDQRISEEVADSLRQVTVDFPNVRWLRKPAASVTDADQIGTIDLLYIDGDHVAFAPYWDLMRLKDKLRPGAIVAFHDFDSEPDVTHSVRRLEAEGVIVQREVSGTMYVGQILEQRSTETKTINAYVGLPNNHDIIPEAWESVRDSARGHEKWLRAFVQRREFSILTANFNRCIVQCLNSGTFDFCAIHHSDLKANAGWLGVMIEDMNRVGADAMHASVPIKNGDGLTSTALAYSNDPWQMVRRITQTELQKLPEVFDVEAVNAALHTNAERLLCNTGILVLRVDDWLKGFAGFTNRDRIVRVSESEWRDDVVPEDWNFGHWCADNGVKVWGSRKIVTHHFGRQRYSSDMVWGDEVDQFWAKHQK